MAERPEATCHSMWQWKSQIPEDATSVSQSVCLFFPSPLSKWVGGFGLFYSLTRVIRPETQHNVALRVQHKSVPPHGDLGEVCLRDVRVRKGAGILLGPPDGLEGMSVQMERVLARVGIVDDDLDNLALLEHEGVRPLTVDLHVGGEIPATEGRVEGGDLRGRVGDVVEKGAECG